MILNEYMQFYLETYKRPYISINTYIGYETCTRLYILPQFGNCKLRKLKSNDIQKFLNALYLDKPRQARTTYIIFKSAINKAIELKYIKRNPFDTVYFKTKFKSNSKALTKSQESQLLAYLSENNHILGDLVRFYLLTGVRRSEALTLRKKDIQENKILIRGTKTSGSSRTLPLTKELKNLLIKYDSDIIFNFTARYVNKKFKEICDKLGFEDITIHSLRHTFATRCLEQNVPIKLVQKWLGHSSYTITAEIYTHILTDYEIKVANKLKL